MLFPLSAIWLTPYLGLRPSLPSSQVSHHDDIIVLFLSQHLPYSVVALIISSLVHGLSLLLEGKLPGIRGCVFCLLLYP